MLQADTLADIPASTEVTVWDPFVRFLHWSVALTILVNAFTEDAILIHEWTGYAAVVLVVLRLLWGIVGPRAARFSAFPPNAFAALRYVRAIVEGRHPVHLSHNPLGALMVYNIWGTVLVLGMTGYLMGTERFFGYEWLAEVHEAVFAWMLFSVTLHVGGVLFNTWLTGVPLVRSMITGRKTMPGDAETE